MNNRELWFWLVNVHGMGIKRIQLLLERFKTIERIHGASKKELLSLQGLPDKVAEAMFAEKEVTKEKYIKMQKKGISFVCWEDPDYPEKIKEFSDAPYGLYYLGKLLEKDKVSIAIVGARNCSVYGREMAKWFARELSMAGVQVISGMARGIDGYAHAGAMESGSETFAVLGSGIDVCYPPEHRWLYNNMIKKGGVISEYGLGVKPLAGQFPMRNRIISGLCHGILIIEAKERSGSLITADIGLEQGKDIFVVPGRIGDTLSYGCNNLIKMGAYLVQSPQDILDTYSFSNPSVQKEWKKINNMLETKEKIVYANLSYNPKHMNELIIDTKFSLSEVMECLVSLELKGYIKQTMKNFYIVRSD